MKVEGYEERILIHDCLIITITNDYQTTNFHRGHHNVFQKVLLQGRFSSNNLGAMSLLLITWPKIIIQRIWWDPLHFYLEKVFDLSYLLTRESSQYVTHIPLSVLQEKQNLDKYDHSHWMITRTSKSSHCLYSCESLIGPKLLLKENEKGGLCFYTHLSWKDTMH